MIDRLETKSITRFSEAFANHFSNLSKKWTTLFNHSYKSYDITQTYEFTTLAEQFELLLAEKNRGTMVMRMKVSSNFLALRITSCDPTISSC